VLLEELGRGDMGIVYRAKQRCVNRLVALKVICPDRLASMSLSNQRKTIDRFRMEAEGAARIKHDNLVAVNEVGCDAGMHYFSMRFVEGSSIAEAVGTPTYMSPEQFEDASRIGPAADIYGLGATLYCILSGRPPIQASSAFQTMKQVLETDAVPLRQLNPAVDRDLETIFMKRLDKAPARRYESSAALRENIDEAIKRCEELLTENPRDLDDQYLLSLCYRLRADLFAAQAQGDPQFTPAAIDDYSKASRIVQKLSDLNSSVGKHREELIRLWINLGQHFA
jgi:serine/threonine protein kinase